MLQRRGPDKQLPSGQVVPCYEDVAEVAAEVMPGRGREFFAAAQIQATAPCEIRIRYRPDVDETWRALRTHGAATDRITDYWDIMAPPVQDAKTGVRDLLLMCNRGTAEGWRNEQTAGCP